MYNNEGLGTLMVFLPSRDIESHTGHIRLDGDRVEILTDKGERALNYPQAWCMIEWGKKAPSEPG